MRRYVVWSVLCCLTLNTVACGDNDNAEPNNNSMMMEENQKPTADISSVNEGVVGASVFASAANSSDPEDDDLTYTWTLSTPDGSSATLSDTTTQDVEFTPDVDGDYVLTLVVNDGELDSEEVTQTISVTDGEDANDAPVADAGMDVTVELGSEVTLDGSNSSDPNVGDSLTYEWSITTNPGTESEQQITGADAEMFTFVPDVVGEYVVTLTVNDGDKSSSDTVTVTVSESVVNTAPTADAGEDQTVDVGIEFSLDGTGSSDPDVDDTLTYAWAITTDPSNGVDMLTDADTATPKFSPSVAGVYEITLTVADEAGEMSSDTVAITVVDAVVNLAPTADAGADQSVSQGELVTLDGSASTDPEDDGAGMALTYAWEITTDPSNGVDMLTGADTPMPTFTPSVAGTYELTLTVTDSAGESSTDTVTVVVAEMGANQVPVAVAGQDQTVMTGAVVSLDGSASTDAEDDAAGTPLTYAWAITTDPSNGVDMLSSTDTAKTTFVPSVTGTYELTLTVTDSEGAMSTDVVTITVEGLISVNQPPVAVAGDDRYLVLGYDVSFDGSGSTDFEDDVAGTPLTYAWAITSDPSNGADMLTGADTATPSFTPSVLGTYELTLTVTDSTGQMNTDVLILNVIEAPTVILGEVIEGSGNNKALELFNYSAVDQDLAAVHVATVRNGATSINSSFDAQGSLSAGAVFTLCHSSRDPLVITQACDGEDSNALNYNGDDVVVVYVEQDGISGYDQAGGDHILDVFGQIGVQPATRIFGEKGYNRCDFTPFDGQSSFVYTMFYTENATQDDFSDLGVSPVMGCGTVMNLPPSADAGSDQLVDLGDMVTLDGSGSTDPEDDAAGTALTYAWVLTTDPSNGVDMLTGADTAAPTFTPSVAGTYELTLTVTDSAGEMDTAIVTVIVRDSSMVTVPQLFISEVVEGSSNNKAFEIFNGSNADIDLTDLSVANLSNGASSTTNALELTGSLASGAVLTVCHGSIDMTLGVTCDLTNSSAAGFNGDDTLVIFIEDGTSSGFNPAEDIAVDVFGQIGVRPGSSPYANKGYERCNFTLFDGSSAFTAGYYTEETMIDVFSGIGVAPMMMNGAPVSTCAGTTP